MQKCNGETNGDASSGQKVKINANVDAGTVEISGPKTLVDKAVKLCKQAVFGETQATIKLQSRSAMNIVFGKDFKNIQQLQNTTGAKFDMDKETFTLHVSGKKEQVDAARGAVSSLLQRCKGITIDIKAADVGAVYGKVTGNLMGAVEAILATAWVNVAYSLIGGMPLVSEYYFCFIALQL